MVHLLAAPPVCEALCPGPVRAAGLCVQALSSSCPRLGRARELCQLCGWALCPGLVPLCPRLGRAPELCQLSGWALCPGLVLVLRPPLAAPLNSANSVQKGVLRARSTERKTKKDKLKEKERKRERERERREREGERGRRERDRCQETSSFTIAYLLPRTVHVQLHGAVQCTLDRRLEPKDNCQRKQYRDVRKQTTKKQLLNFYMVAEQGSW